MIFFLILSLIFTRKAFAEEIRDIKPPVYFPANYLPLIIIAVLIFLAGLVALVIFLLKKIKSKKAEPVLPVKPAHQIAYEALSVLKAKNLPTIGKIKQYYSELSDIVRHYIEDRFSIRAPEMTTEEFLFSLQNSAGLTGAHKNLLREFLNHCDMVKFAKYGPTAQEVEDSFAAAKRLVDETKIEENQTQESRVK